MSIDKTILKLADLQCGEYAQYKEDYRKWIVDKKNS